MSAMASSELCSRPGDDPQTVVEAVNQAEAEAQSMKTELDGKEVVIVKGAFGSGKSTLVGFLCGHQYEENDGQVAPKPGCQGFETGLEGGVAHTKRAECRQLPGSDVFAVDLPGWDDDQGLKADLVASVWHHAVVDASSTVRVVSVQSAVKYDRTNERGRPALVGLDAVAGCFKEPSQWVGSVAFIITQGKARDLVHWAANLIGDVMKPLKGETGLLEGVRRKACQQDEESIRLLPYVERIHEYCRKSLLMSEHVTTGDSADFLKRLKASQLFLWPVNPLDPTQARPLMNLVLSMPPVPRSAMSRRLPKGTLLQLERLLSNIKDNLRSQVLEIDWAADPVRIETALKAASFMSTVMRHEWTDDAPRHQADLAGIFVLQNKLAITALTGAISREDLEGFLKAKTALDQQQVFYQSVSNSKMLSLTGWKAPAKAAEEAAATLRSEVEKEVPADLATALWDGPRCRRLEFFMKVAEVLGECGQDVPRDFKMKMEGLLKHLDMTVKALEGPDTVQDALEKLESLLQLRSALPDVDFVSKLAGAKACCLDELKNLSKRVVDALLKSPLSASKEASKLRRFCSSQRLCSLLEEDLAQLLTDTLTHLVPSKEDTSDWPQALAGRQPGKLLEALVRAVQRAVMLQAMHEDDPESTPEWIQPFLKEMGPKVLDSGKAAEEVIKGIMDKLGRSRRSNRSNSSTCGDEDESSEEHTQENEGERVQRELSWLKELLVLDELLVEDIASVFKEALQHLRNSLKRLAKKIPLDLARASGLSSQSSLDANAKNMKCLGDAIALVMHALEKISLDEKHIDLNKLLLDIEKQCSEDEGRVASFLDANLEPFRTLASGAAVALEQNGCDACLNDALHNALVRLKLLSPLRPADVEALELQLQKTVVEWYNKLLTDAQDHLSRADQMSSFMDMAKAVVMGLAFEQGSCFKLLCERSALGFLKSSFEGLVTDVGSNLVRRASAARSGAGIKGFGTCWEALHIFREALGRVWRGSELFQIVDQEYGNMMQCMDLVEKEFHRVLANKDFDEAYRKMMQLPSRTDSKEYLANSLSKELKRLKSWLQSSDPAAARAASELLDLAVVSHHSKELGISQEVGELRAELETGRAQAKRAVLNALEGRASIKAALAGFQGFFHPGSGQELLRMVTGHLEEKKRLLCLVKTSHKDVAAAAATTEKEDSMESLKSVVVWLKAQAQVRPHLLEALSDSSDYEGTLELACDRVRELYGSQAEIFREQREERRWGSARSTFQRLKEVIEDLEGRQKELGPEVTKLVKNLTDYFPPLKDGELEESVQEASKGDFEPVLSYFIRASEGECNKIYDELRKLVKSRSRMDTSVSACREHKDFLERFVEELGKEPPQKISGLAKKVETDHRKSQEALSQQEQEAIATLKAAAKGEDLRTFAEALRKLLPFCSADAFPNEVGEFWRKFQEPVNWVKRDLLNKNIDSLDRCLESLRRWVVDKWSKLAQESELQQLVLGTLLKGERKEGVTDLAGFAREFLSAERLSLISQAHEFLRARDFKEWRLCFDLLARVDDVLGTGSLDASAALDIAKGLKTELLAILRTKAGLGHQFSRSLSELQEAELCLGKICPAVLEAKREVDTVVDEVLLQPCLEQIEGDCNPQKAAEPLLKLRDVANKAPLLFKEVHKKLEEVLRDLDRRWKDPDALAGLSQALMTGPGSDTGNQVVKEHGALFGGAHERRRIQLFNQRMGEVPLEEVVAVFCQQSGIDKDDVERGQLLECLKENETLFSDFVRAWLSRPKSMDAILDQIRNDFRSLKQDLALNPGDRDLGCRALTQIAAAWSAYKCGEEYLSLGYTDQKSMKFLRPHPGQMLVLFRLLQLHKPPPSTPKAGRRVLRNVASAVGAAGQAVLSLLTPSGLPERGQPPLLGLKNHLAQLLTGEGKALVLAMLASYLGLRDIQCDIVCHREFLIVQDEGAMAALFKVVGVQDLVRYRTCEQLCQEVVQSMNDDAQRLLQSCLDPGAEPSAQTPSRLRNAPRIQDMNGPLAARHIAGTVILLDEADVIFSRRIQGKRWNAGIPLRCPEIVALLRLIYDQHYRGSPLTLQEVLHTNEFKSLHRRSQELGKACADALGCLIKNVDDSDRQPDEWHLTEDGKVKVGYKDGDEIRYDKVLKHKTVFVYLDLEQKGCITKEQADYHLSLDFFCGSLNLSNLPKRYNLILGVTGTLPDLKEEPIIAELLRAEYQIEHFSYVPSVWGEKALTKDMNDVIIAENQANWLARIALEVDHITARGDSVLVFFKKRKDLEQFPNWKGLNWADESTTPEKLKAVIAAATISGTVTLLTRAFARGTDFEMPKKGHTLVVMLTYQPSTKSEEEQTMGRTARQGNKGLFMKVLEMEQLRKKFNFSVEELHSVKDNVQLRHDLLAQKQKEKMQRKAEEMLQRRKEAEEAQVQSQGFRLALHSGKSVEEKLRELRRLNCPFSFKHYTCLLDCSWSMSGERWNQLQRAYRRFKEELSSQNGAEVRLTSLLFGKKALVVQPTHAPLSNVPPLPAEKDFPDGDHTFYAEAFNAAAHVLSQPQSQDAMEILIFLTDGEAHDNAVGAVEALLQAHSQRIHQFICIGFGADAKDVLAKSQGVTEVFTRFNVPVKSVPAETESQLVEEFVQSAGIDVLRM